MSEILHLPPARIAAVLLLKATHFCNIACIELSGGSQLYTTWMIHSDSYKMTTRLLFNSKPDSQTAADTCSPGWRRSSPGSPAGTAWRPWPGWHRPPWREGGWQPQSPWSPLGPAAPRHQHPAGRSHPASNERVNTLIMVSQGCD